MPMLPVDMTKCRAYTAKLDAERESHRDQIDRDNAAREASLLEMRDRIAEKLRISPTKVTLFLCHRGNSR